MKRTYLKWIIPVILLYIMVGIACLGFGGFFKNEVIETELSYLSKSLKYGLDNTDMIVKTAVDYNDATAVSLNKYDLISEKKDIVILLSQLSKNEYVKTAVACDSDGKGFDNRGNSVSIAEEDFFQELKSKYSSGGKGFLQIHEAGIFAKNNLIIINQVDFQNDVKGFLIADMDITGMEGTLFPNEDFYDSIALVSLTGQVIAGKDGGSNFFERKDIVLHNDVIKLNISQKNEMISPVDGYGYMVMVPSEVTAAATIALISDEKLESEPNVRWRLVRYRLFVVALMIIILFYIALNYIVLYVFRYLRKRRAARDRAKIRLDKLTGLLNEFGVKDELQKYINSTRVEKGGALFVISLNVEGKADKDSIIKALAEILPQKYRLTDVIGRGEDNTIIIFLKDIIEAKDIRKQTDELQMLLYDFKTEHNNEETKMVISVGRSIYPKDGEIAEELLELARGAISKTGKEVKSEGSI